MPCCEGADQKQALETLKAKLLEVEERVHSVARPTGEEDEDADVNDQPTCMPEAVLFPKGTSPHDLH